MFRFDYVFAVLYDGCVMNVYIIYLFRLLFIFLIFLILDFPGYDICRHRVDIFTERRRK